MCISLLLDVDLLNPTILREDIDDLRWWSENSDQRLHWNIDTKTVALQNQIDALEATVTILQGKVAELQESRDDDKLETRLTNLDHEIQNVRIHANNAHNRANTIEDVILQHHPENARQLRYPVIEEESGDLAPSEETPVGTSTITTTEQPTTEQPTTEGSASPVVEILHV